MGIDQGERRRRQKADAQGTRKTEPIAAIPKRVIDSPVFAQLPPTAIVVLLLLARNLEKDRNGHVLLSAPDAKKRGIDKKTLYRSLKTLLAIGFIFQTASGGFGRCARYALTWLPMCKDTTGLHVDTFRRDAWKDHDAELSEWRKARGKMSPSRGQKGAQPQHKGDKKGPRAGGQKTPR